MREIILDTETTGLDPVHGHRMVEVGAIELVNHLPTGNHFHKYMNPERKMSQGAYEVHGLGDEFLADKPLFKDIAVDFLAFIGDATLVIHNADFDMKFINAELEWAGFAPIPYEQVLCTLQMARKKFPGAPASLDALCKRFEVDNSNRQLHGALLDSELLADVYMGLLGGRQMGMELAKNNASTNGKNKDSQVVKSKEKRDVRDLSSPSDAEQEAHANFLKGLKEMPLWEKVEV